MPTSTSRTGLELRPVRRRTAPVASAAPRNALPSTWKLPRNANQPPTMAPTAPAPAPDDTPRMYGSASSFFVIVCSSRPQTASPAPQSAAKSERGKRMSQRMFACVEACGDAPRATACTSLRMSATGISIEPNRTEKTRLKSSKQSRDAPQIMWNTRPCFVSCIGKSCKGAPPLEDRKQ